MPVVAGYPITFNAGNASEIASLGSGAVVQNTTVLEGAYSLQQGSSASMIDTGLNLTTLGLRFLFRLVAFPAVDQVMISFAMAGPLDILHVYVNNAGNLFVAGANAYGLATTLTTSTLALNTTYTVSVATDTAAGGIVRLWLGSTLEIDVTHGNAKTGIVEFRASSLASPNQFIYDDFYLIDTAELPPLTDVPPPVVQVARPGADAANPDGWTTHSGATTGLYATLADENDSTYSRTVPHPTDDVYVAGPLVWDAPYGDPGVNTGHLVRWRYGKELASTETSNLTVELRHSYASEASPGTLIATVATLTNISAFPVAGSYTLSVGEAAVVRANAANLFARFLANAP